MSQQPAPAQAIDAILGQTPDAARAAFARVLINGQPGNEVFARLTAPFPNVKQDMMRPTDGFRPRYVEGLDVIDRLNDVVGLCWSFEVGDPQWMHQQQQASYVFVKGRLSFLTSAGLIVREQYGQCMLSKHQQSGLLIDPGGDLKAAGTDALKKCATLFGIGRELYAKDETPMQGMTRMVEQAPQQPIVPGQQMQQIDPNAAAGTISVQMFRQLLTRIGYSESQLLAQYGFQQAEQLTEGQLSQIMTQIGGVQARAAR